VYLWNAEVAVNIEERIRKLNRLKAITSEIDTVIWMSDSKDELGVLGMVTLSKAISLLQTVHGDNFVEIINDAVEQRKRPFGESGEASDLRVDDWLRNSTSDKPGS
jgi:hypothetical protein